MPTQTTNYSLDKPLVNSAVDQDLWGNELNDDLDDIDTLLRSGITISTQSSQTSGFTASASISIKYLYPCDATSAAFNVTIPAASTSGNGATVFVKKTDSTAHAVTLIRSGSDTLDGGTSLTLSSEDDCYGLVSDGVSNWASICEIATALVPDASTSTKGIIQLATNAEVTTGTNSLKAVVPSALPFHPGVAKAWVNFNGTGTVAVRGSYNVSSITDNGTGDYTINFTTAMASANYAFAGGGVNTIANTPAIVISMKSTSAMTTDSLRIQTIALGLSSNAVSDCEYVTVVIFE